MTKSKKLVFGLIILLVACWIYASPYLAVRSMKDAVKNRDEVTLADYVNFPALKESLKASFTAQMTKSMEEMKDNPFAALGAAMAITFINPMIDSLVSPEGLAAMMNGHKPGLTNQKEEKIQEARSGAGDDEPIVKMGYENINRFTVKASNKINPTQEITMVFLRDGLSWKLSAVRFPANYSPIKDAEDASEMSIESSDLEADPAQTNVITLNAILHNRASYTKAYPNLELTLTDAQDKALARTTFRPVEYLKPDEDEKQGLAANHNLSVKLSIDTTDLKPSGYRLFLFYPKKYEGLQPQPSLYAEKIKLFRPRMAPPITLP